MIADAFGSLNKTEGGRPFRATVAEGIAVLGMAGSTALANEANFSIKTALNRINIKEAFRLFIAGGRSSNGAFGLQALTRLVGLKNTLGSKDRTLGLQLFALVDDGACIGLIISGLNVAHIVVVVHRSIPHLVVLTLLRVEVHRSIPQLVTVLDVITLRGEVKFFQAAVDFLVDEVLDAMVPLASFPTFLP